ncbi:MAG: isoaspartyl peptidase/L-asparaginase [Candidatus Korobacteraceae bacterium]
MSKPTAIIAIHGGAGTILRAEMTPARERSYLDALGEIVRAGQKLLAEGASALDAVTEAVRLLEDCLLFNAGRGAVFTAAGTHELDAAVMDGKSRSAGAVACVRRLPNPILAARAVMEHSGHVLMAGEGAEEFAQSRGLPLVEQSYFYTDFRYAEWQRALQLGAEASREPHGKIGTVGAVALDAAGNLAAATSTGGTTNKRVGRVGDTPVIGAGCYADHHVAVSSTGMGEMFIRLVAAHDISAQIEYGGRSLQEAAEYTVMEKLPQIQGSGGLIAIDRLGNVALPFNTEGMYRGFARVGDTPATAIYGDKH